MKNKEDIINSMYDKLLDCFDMAGALNDEVRKVAESAYDRYCKGNGQLTENKCLDEVYGEWYIQWMKDQGPEEDIENNR